VVEAGVVHRLGGIGRADGEPSLVGCVGCVGCVGFVGFVGLVSVRLWGFGETARFRIDDGLLDLLGAIKILRLTTLNGGGPMYNIALDGSTVGSGKSESSLLLTRTG
jgi:hypothetical protein